MISPTDEDILISSEMPVEPTTIRGTFILRIMDDSKEREFSVPDPEDLPKSLPVTPSQLFVLQFIRDNVKPAPSQVHTETEVRLHFSNDQDSSGDEEIVPDDSNKDGNSLIYLLSNELEESTVIKFLEDIKRTIELGKSNAKRTYRFHQREQQTQTSPSNLRKKKLERALRTGNPFKVGVWKCCSRNLCFEKVGADRCYEEYKAVNSMTPKQAKRHLISMYDPSEKVFRMGGQIVCSRFLGKCLGFSNDMQCAIKNTPKARGSPIARSRPREVKRKTKRVFIALFIKRLAQMFGDAMPNRDHITLPILNRKA